ncbi:MAG: hypothetical protein V1870_02855 [Candidatus Aenigmatarchaeota archaeon]
MTYYHDRKESIIVPQLTMDGKVVIPEFSLSKDIEKMRNRYEYIFSALECLQFNPPTLTELRHAFFDMENGDFICPDFRENVFSLMDRGTSEWTSTFIQQSEEGCSHIILINRPYRIYINECNLLAAEYDGYNSFHVSIPPNGWVTKYDIETGWPLKTSEIREDAEKIFGNDSSYFHLTTPVNGIGSVCCAHSKHGNGPFYIHAGIGPCRYDGNVGMRSCSK